MKVTKDTLEIEVGTWDDPGDYPNALASGPLPSYQYIEDVSGEVVIELEEGDEPVKTGTYDSLEEINYDVFEVLNESEPDGVNVLKWDVTCTDKTLTITVAEFEQDGDYEPYEPDDDPRHFYD